MARGNKNPSPKTRWKKGQSGNPLGGQKHDPVLREIRNLTKKELVDIGNLIIKGDLPALKKLANAKKDVPGLTMWIASVCVKGIERGDVAALDILLNRLVGKVKDETLMTAEISAAPQIIVTLPSNGREAK
jgi:hypothetical protein